MEHPGQCQTVFQLREGLAVLPAVDRLLVDHQLFADLDDADAPRLPHAADVGPRSGKVDLRYIHMMPPSCMAGAMPNLFTLKVNESLLCMECRVRHEARRTKTIITRLANTKQEDAENVR